MVKKRNIARRLILSVADFVMIPFLVVASVPMRLIYWFGMRNLPRSRRVLQSLGVMPIIDQYYQPLFKTENLTDLRASRPLPGIDFRVAAQKQLLAQFSDVAILRQLPQTKADDDGFYYENPAFVSGDADVWFHMIRHFKPQHIIEIGSGHSTRMARRAIAANCADDASYSCKHICIEPYEAPWLERSGATIIRQKVEDINHAIFDILGEDDFLFIDSSHIIRPQGDVVVEYLQILPRLRPGVITHVHDIFSPRDYPDDWVHEDLKLWNEQYLLEAYLSDNDKVEVLLGVNIMKHEATDLLKIACPGLSLESEPGSFYFRRTTC